MWNTSSASGKRIVLQDGRAMLVGEDPASGKLGRDPLVNDSSFTTEPAVGRAPPRTHQRRRVRPLPRESPRQCHHEGYTGRSRHPNASRGPR